MCRFSARITSFHFFSFLVLRKLFEIIAQNKPLPSGQFACFVAVKGLTYVRARSGSSYGPCLLALIFAKKKKIENTANTQTSKAFPESFLSMRHKTADCFNSTREAASIIFSMIESLRISQCHAQINANSFSSDSWRCVFFFVGIPTNSLVCVYVCACMCGRVANSLVLENITR